jgi:hypothetical protein
MMDKRPLSLTIIGWGLLISSAFSAFASLRMASNPVAMKMIAKTGVPLIFEQGWGIIGAVVIAACGYGILKGLPWSRVLYVAWSLLALVVTIFILPLISMLVLSVLFIIGITYFLYRPIANDWFAASGLQLRRGER